MKITNHLDGEFLPYNISRGGTSHPLPRDTSLQIETRPDKERGVVYIELSEPINMLVVLPGEARQLAESLLQVAAEVDPEGGE